MADKKYMSYSQDPLAELLQRDRRYHRDAYVFVFEALRYAQQVLGLGQSESAEDVEEHNQEQQIEQHVTGQQLCGAIRDYAIRQYGVLAKNVLNHWGVHSTSDFGQIVFNLIEAGHMKKTHTDRREDFDNVFDFEEALRDVFQPMTSDSSEER